MEYNTQREDLVMPDYGRHIQQMVDHALTIEDRDERTKCAHTIAALMTRMYPALKNDDNYQQKIWDHIAMMSGFRLDVDTPFPLPTCQEAAAKVTQHMHYPMSYIRFRAYGHIVQEFIIKATDVEDPLERKTLAAMAAMFMKRILLQNGKDSNIEERVCADLAELSDGALQYNFAELQNVVPKNDAPQQRRQWNGRQDNYKNKKQNNNNNKGQRKYNNNRKRY